MSEAGNTVTGEELLQVCRDGDLKFIEKYLADGGDPNGHDEYFTLLRMVCARGHIDIIRLLFKALGGSEKLNQCKRNNMILHSACWNRQLEAVKELINLGYDPNTKDDHGRTALSVSSILEDLETIRFLLSVGADTNILDIWNKTPLIHVCEGCDDIEVVKELLQPSSFADGTNPNIRTKISGDTALTKSITRGKIDFVKLLLLSPVEGIDRIDKLGRAYLEYAKSLDPAEYGEIAAVLENYIPSFHSLTLRCIDKNKIRLNNLSPTLISAWSDV